MKLIYQGEGGVYIELGSRSKRLSCSATCYQASPRKQYCVCYIKMTVKRTKISASCHDLQCCLGLRTRQQQLCCARQRYLLVVEWLTWLALDIVQLMKRSSLAASCYYFECSIGYKTRKVVFLELCTSLEPINTRWCDLEHFSISLRVTVALVSYVDHGPLIQIFFYF